MQILMEMDIVMGQQSLSVLGQQVITWFEKSLRQAETVMILTTCIILLLFGILIVMQMDSMRLLQVHLVQDHEQTTTQHMN